MAWFRTTGPQTPGPAKGSTPGLENAGGASAAASSTRGDIDRLAGQQPWPRQALVVWRLPKADSGLSGREL
jgi:hypothetical protein